MDITELLALSAKCEASDLHLSAGVAPMIRVDGELGLLDAHICEEHTLCTQLAGLVGDAQWRRFEQEKELDTALTLPDGQRFRINVFRQARGVAAAFRAIPARIPGLDELGLTELARLAQLRRGLVLVVGATGSGKSTTLAALVDRINETRRGHVITIEDPVEYLHACKQCLISQRQVSRDTHGVDEALRSALREDPDIILVGEMRDPTTIRLALTAAETGHLVLGTLHAASAAKCVDRIIDAFPGTEKPVVRAMLAESLQVVVAQVLIKRRGGGRVAAHETLVATAAVRNLIREGQVAQLASAIQTGARDGMQTLEAALARLVAEGVVTPEAARGVAP